MDSSAIVQLFYNASAGRCTPALVKRLEQTFIAAGATVIRTPSSQGPAECASSATHAAIIGGDGTVRHVAAALARAGKEIPVAIWPAGTVNLLARERLPHAGEESFVRTLLSGKADRMHYPVHLGEKMFLACASVGPDSLVVASVSPRLKRRVGRLAYVLAALRLLARWPRTTLQVTAEGRAPLACEAVFVAKGRFYAGPWSFAPAACTSDGLLHVVAMKQARRRDFLGFVLCLLRHRDAATLPGVHAFTCRSLHIAGDRPLPVQADGDMVGLLPVTLKIGARPLRFC